MSAIVLYIVRCDTKACLASITGPTAWEAREVGRAKEWQCGKNLKSLDLCPDHAL